MDLGYLIAAIMPYVAVAFFVFGLGYKIIYWSKAPVNLHWELFPYPHTVSEQLKEMLTEVFTLRSLYLFNRKFWLPSLMMHYGIYLVVTWLVVLLLGFPFAPYLGMLGGVLALAGSFSLLLLRLFIDEVRKISVPVEYFNLIFIFLLALSSLFTGFLADFQVRFYLLSLFTLKPALSIVANYHVPLLLLELFLIYVPFTRMAHFAVKFFTYHKIKWGELH
ncbi:respiratory nitrate reductase subunit gamma [Desulfofundulus thermocisternus]|uniref:respiratory nitrate reductase subunit gamma n=1 Tax=Desulfofundulus thermocisternus TaxID=42471 RepID=UPI0019DB0A65|nr:respiratory nitrate reductase subunit gamma [Desulfofundulus thermocisternus]MBE3585898.1 nitrate reductase [Thermoanaerobacter sp.]MCS5696803.1 respiratory nitrate reductase subunit gamma [Desulfofundulus thermocisternus]